MTTVYIAGVFEFIENGATDKVTKYYEGNALRRSGYGVDDGVFYLLRDHLSSSSVILNQSGAVVTNGNQYYTPYGSNRGGTPFSTVTTKRFTGQYHENGLTQSEGLSYYGARWYDAKLGRFLSADTIVPGPNNPQAFNRYSYVLNNPLKYIDPTGHGHMCTADPYDPGCAGSRGESSQPTKPRPPVLSQYPSAAFPRKPTKIVQQVTTWQDEFINNTRQGLPVAKALTKTFWGCAIGSCAASMNNWTGSVDVGGMWAPFPFGVAARGQASLAVDHEGGIAFILGAGGGGSTPVLTGGLTLTATNAPSVNKLSGKSVQGGGTLGTALYGEAIAFSDSDNGQHYFGLSVAPLTRLSLTIFPPPLEASVHATAMNSWVWSVNIIDGLFYPLEWVLKED